MGDKEERRVRRRVGAGPDETAPLAAEEAKQQQQQQQPAAAPAAGPAPPAAAAVRTVQLGGVAVAAVGLGTLPCGVAYPDASKRPDAAAFTALVAAAAAAASPAPLFVDTADTYCHPHGATHALERQLCDASASLAPPASLVLSTKAGMTRVLSESTGWRPADMASPGRVRRAIEAAKAALSPTAPLFLWSLHHADGLKAPGALEAALSEAAGCVRDGLVLNVGLCNATAGQLARALAVCPIAALQNEWSLWQREAEKPLPAGAAASSKKGTLAACAAAGVTFVAHSPLGGLKARRGERPPGGGSAGLGPLAAARGMSAHAAALACLLHRGGQLGARVVAIPGARSAGHAADSVSAAALVLTDAEVAAVMGPL